MTINERLNQARTRLQQAQEGDDDAAKQAAQSEVDRLEWAKQQGLLTGDQAGSFREEGRGSGTTEARRAQAEKLGVPIDGLDDELDRLAEIRRNQQSEADREREARETAENERSTAARERDEAYAQIAQLTQEKVMRDALSEANLQPNRLKAALRIADTDLLDVDDDGNVSGIEEVVSAVKEQVPEWFSEPAPDNPPETPQSQQTTTKGKSYARQWAEEAFGSNTR